MKPVKNILPQIRKQNIEDLLWWKSSFEAFFPVTNQHASRGFSPLTFYNIQSISKDADL